MPSPDLPIEQSAYVKPELEIESEQYQVQLKAKGLKHHLEKTEIQNLYMGQKVQLQLDPDNPVDINAIRLTYDDDNDDDSSGKTICFIAYKQAKLLSPLIQNKSLSIVASSISSVDQITWGKLKINVILRSSTSIKLDIENGLVTNNISTGDNIYSNRLGVKDYTQSLNVCQSNPELLQESHKFTLSPTAWSSMHANKWKKGSKKDEMRRYEILEEVVATRSNQDHSNDENSISTSNRTSSLQANNSSFVSSSTQDPICKKYKVSSPSVIQLNLQSVFLGWTPFDPVALLAEVSPEEIAQCTWPPSSSLLAKLGLAPADDMEWYSSHGLLCPAQWTVTAAMKLKGYAQSTTNSSNTMSLEGSMHGVESCWLPSVLTDIESFISSDHFFIPFHGIHITDRKRDMLSRVFGGGYVLGQKEDDLKLLHGGPHTPLTAMICRGKNIIYTLVHLDHVKAPGFNTLIFALAWRGAGFGYHCDQVSNLPNKNLTMAPLQPVCTTILYQRLDDSGKETVYWGTIQRYFHLR